MSGSQLELMTKWNPVLLYQGLKAFKGAEIGVDYDLHQGAQLTGAVADVGAVNQHI